MPIATRSMATRSTARLEVVESSATELPPAGRGRKKQKDLQPQPQPAEPIASASAVPATTNRKAPSTVVTKKTAKSRPPVKKVSISTDEEDEEEEDRRTKEKPKEKFAVPKGKPPKKLASVPVPVPSSSSDISTKKGRNISEADTGSSGDDIGRLTRSSARLKTKKVIPEVRKEVESVAVIKTTKRNASKPVLEPRNEIESGKPSKPRGRPKAGAKPRPEKESSPIRRKEIIEDESDEEYFVKIVKSKPTIRLDGVKSKGGGKANQNVTNQIETEIQQHEKKTAGGMMLRNQKPKLLDKYDIEPDVFASQCRIIASVMLEPNSVLSMNVLMNKFQRFREDMVKGAEIALSSLKAKTEAEKKAKMGLQPVPEISKKDKEDFVQAIPNLESNLRRSQDMFASPLPPVTEIQESTGLNNIDQQNSEEIDHEVVTESDTRNENRRLPSASCKTVGSKLESFIPDPVGCVTKIQHSSARMDSGISSISSGATWNSKESSGSKPVRNKRSRSERSDEEIEEKTAAPKLPVTFNFQASAETENVTRATKKFILDAGPCKPGLGLSNKIPGGTKFPVSAADATFVKLPRIKEAEGNAPILNQTFDKDKNDSVDMMEALEAEIQSESSVLGNLDKDESSVYSEYTSVFEKFDIHVEIVAEKDPVTQTQTKETPVQNPSLNETVCIINPIFPHVSSTVVSTPPVPWPSVPILEVLEEEEEISTVEKNVKAGTVLKEQTKTNNKSSSSSSSSYSSATSSCSFKSAASQPVAGYCKPPIKVHGANHKFLENGKVKIDINKKNALEREEEAKRNKAEILLRKQEFQKKKNEEWKKKTDKIKFAEEMKKTQKEQMMSKPKVQEAKPAIKLPKPLFANAAFKTIEPPAFRCSGPMKYKSPAPSQPLLNKPLFLGPTSGTPVGLNDNPEPCFKTPTNSLLDTTADMTINSYDITVYEDLDEDLKHRENKHIPSWAQNKRGVSEALFRTVLYRDHDVSRANFPKVSRGFKLYGGVYRE